MTIIKRIRQLLIDSGVKPDQVRNELAAACGVSYQAVQQWDGTTKKISPEHLAAIAKKWRTTTDYLITGKEPPTLPEATEYDLLNESSKKAVRNLIHDLYHASPAKTAFQTSEHATMRESQGKDC